MILISLLLVSQVFAAIDFKYIGRINANQPSFVRVSSFSNTAPLLITSSTAPQTKGRVSVEPSIASKYTKPESVALTEVSADFLWPNSINLIPASVFGPDVKAIVVPDGDFAAPYNNGGVYILELDPTDLTKKKKIHRISAAKPGYVYHTGGWVDVNNDGYIDYVTPRSNGKAGQGELVWFEQPKTGLLSDQPWNEYIITQGPEIDIDIAVLPQYKNALIVFAAEYFGKRLTVYLVSKPTGAVINSRVIDESIDAAYTVQVTDLNDDGVLELLVTNRVKDESKSGIFMYKLPQDLFNAKYERIQIASGFKPAPSAQGTNQTPGFAYPIFPSSKSKDWRYILVAGDGDQSAYLLRPLGNFQYQKQLIVNVGGTVGTLASGDLNGDGLLEFFVPNYDKNYIEVYQFVETSGEEEQEIVN